MLAESCVGFQIPCETLLKGGLAVAMGFVLFVGSVMLLLSAVFGRRMAYLVIAVAFFGWMTILSTIWLTGFFISQGPTTPRNLGPRGTDPAWVVESLGTSPDPVYEEYSSYPDGDAWRVPGTNENDSSSVQSVTSAAQAFLVEKGNEDLGVGEFDPDALTTTDFTIRNIRFATSGDVSLAAAQGYFTGGGPRGDALHAPRLGQRSPLLVDVPDRLDPRARDPHPVPGPRRALAQADPDGRDGPAVVRTRLGGTMLAQEARLIDQGAVQFVIFGIMVLVIFIALWFTIAK